MRKMNILNKEGFLSDEDRKEPLEHTCSWVTFKTNLDLSEPVKITPLGIATKISAENYSRDLASFIAFWDYFVAKDLNGFSGFNSVKFELIGFEII